MAYISYSSYPNQLDGYQTIPILRDLVSPVVAANYNSLRDAILKIENWLGTTSGGNFVTAINGSNSAYALIQTHINNPTGAHAASAISFIDTNENFDIADDADVQEVIVELAAAVNKPNVIGADISVIPNSGVPNFVNGSGTKFIFNISNWAGEVTNNEVTRTEMRNINGISGIHVFEVSTETPDGTGTLTYASGGLLSWQAPGDLLPGPAVSISGMIAGQWETVYSHTANKALRFARTSASLPSTGLPRTETLQVFGFEAIDGYFSLPISEGSPNGQFKYTNNITVAAANINNLGLNQFVIGGIVYPADRGTLVLQRKTLGSSGFYPIAELNLSAAFDLTRHETGQLVYVPSLSGFDTITLFDRMPMMNYYEDSYRAADGGVLYQDFPVTYYPYQIARYIIPVSHSDLGVGSTLTTPTAVDWNQIQADVSAYRVVHYRAGVDGYSLDPLPSQIYSISDTFGSSNDGNNTVRFSNVYASPVVSAPSVSTLIVTPVSGTPTTLSGINYYSAGSSFDLFALSNANMFRYTYLVNGNLKLSTDAFSLGNTSIDLTSLADAGSVLFSTSNLPVFTDTAQYSASITSATNAFSSHAYVSAYFNSIYSSGSSATAYGAGAVNRILIDGYSTRATQTTEYFTDEAFRVTSALAAWNSSSSLISGNLQCGAPFNQSDVCGLIYPQDDYTVSGISPAQSILIPYTFSGDQYYYRIFNLGHSVSSAALRIVSGGLYPVSFNDISYNNANRFAAISVQIPGATGWMDITQLYETGQDYKLLDDAYGALVSAPYDMSGNIVAIDTGGDFIVPFTFGHINNALNNGIAVRIKYFGAQITTAKQKIITMLELLPLTY